MRRVVAARRAIILCEPLRPRATGVYAASGAFARQLVSGVERDGFAAVTLVAANTLVALSEHTASAS